MTHTNATTPKVFIFPRDDKDLSIMFALNKAVVVFSIVLITVPLVFLLLIITAIREKQRETCNNTQTTGGQQRSRNPNKSSMAGPKIIAFNCAVMITGATVALSNNVFVRSEHVCDIAQKFMSSFYLLALSSTYLLLEVRGRATQAKYTGLAAILQRIVHMASIVLPITTIASFLTTTGYFNSDNNSCLPIIDSNGTVLLMFYSALLSAGHLYLFGLALGRHGVKLHMLPEKLRTLRTINSVVGSERGAQSSTSHNCNDMLRLQRIFQSNFRLALVQTSSTVFAMIWTSLINAFAPDPTVEKSNDLQYLRQLQTCICNLDLLINLSASLSMTSTWQPKRFKKIKNRKRAKVKPLTPFSADSSIVSSLGGGM